MYLGNNRISKLERLLFVNVNGNYLERIKITTLIFTVKFPKLWKFTFIFFFFILWVVNPNEFFILRRIWLKTWVLPFHVRNTSFSFNVELVKLRRIKPLATFVLMRFLNHLHAQGNQLYLSDDILKVEDIRILRRSIDLPIRMNCLSRFKNNIKVSILTIILRNIINQLLKLTSLLVAFNEGLDHSVNFRGSN